MSNGLAEQTLTYKVSTRENIGSGVRRVVSLECEERWLETVVGVNVASDAQR